MAPKKQVGSSKKKKGDVEEDSGSEDIVSGPSDNEEDESDHSDGDEKAQGAAQGADKVGDGSDDEGSDFSELQVDFEFFDLAEIDFHGIRALLNRYLDGDQWDMSGMADALIAQAASVGTAIKANGDVDPVGICSALTLDKPHRIPSVDQVIKFVKKKCPDDLREKLEKAVAEAGTGLVVDERMLNTPPELGPPLISGLFTEVSEVGEPWCAQNNRSCGHSAHPSRVTFRWWETEKRASDALLASFRFKRYLVLTRVYRDDDGEQDGAAAGGAGGPGSAADPKGKAKASGAANKDPVLIYPKPEDQAIHKLCSWSFLWPASVPEATAASDSQSKLTQMRLVMLVDANQAEAIVKGTQAIVDALSAEDDGFVFEEEDAASPPAKKAKKAGGGKRANAGGGAVGKNKKGAAAVVTEVRSGEGKAGAAATGAMTAAAAAGAQGAGAAAGGGGAAGGSRGSAAHNKART